MLASLSWPAWRYARSLRRRSPYAPLQRWQMAYLPVHAWWAAFVVVVFPPLFAYA